MLNSVCIQGRIGKDPEIRVDRNGNPVASFSIANTQFVRGENKSDWYECVAFGKTAEFIEHNFHKGNQIIIVGKLSVSSYEGKNGKVNKVQITVNNAEFCESKGDKQSKSVDQGEPVSNTEFTTVEDNEDLPF